MIRAIVIATCACAAAAGVAHADDIVAGAVIKVDPANHEIYVNIGRARGLSDGVAVRLKRPIALHDPTTRKRVDDWIPIGAATITEAGARMSRAVVGELAAAVKIGDVAEVYVEAATEPEPGGPPQARQLPEPEPEPVTVPEPATATAPEAPTIDPVQREVLAVFAAQSGASLDARIAAWERYQSAHPDGPYGDAIEADLTELRALREAMAPPEATIRDRARVHLDHVAPTHTALGKDVPLVFVIDRPEQVASGWLHYRTAGAHTYHRVLMRREHGIYLRGAVPAAAVTGPVEYFVEVTAPDGTGGVAEATPAVPHRVDLPPATIADRFGGERGRTELTLSMVYLDFANLDGRDGTRTDRELFAEADVHYRMSGLLQAIGAGYGVFTGEGGADTQWTMDNPAPKTGFNYGYAEAEVGTEGRIPTGFALQAMAGVGRGGFELGVEARARIGAADGTNLTALARNIAEIGFLSELRLGTRPRPKLPIGVAVGVLDQPAGGDLAVRLGVDAGYQIGPVAPTLRVSWQGRSIDHGGVGGGLALAFRW